MADTSTGIRSFVRSVPSSCVVRAQLLRSLPQLHRMARQLTRNADDAADLVQEVCRRALEVGDSLSDHSNIRAWLICVLRNLHTDDLRRRGKTQARAEIESPWHPQSIERWRYVTDTEIVTLVGRLRPELRQVWKMSHFQGMGQATIAAKLQIPRATVATRVYRARRHLRRWLEVKYRAELNPSVAS